MGKKSKKRRAKKLSIPASGDNTASARGAVHETPGFDPLDISMHADRREDKIQLLKSLKNLARDDPGRLASAKMAGLNLGAQSALGVIFLLQTYPNDKELREMACATLCALFFTPCCYYIIPFQGLSEICRTMKEELKNVGIQRNILSTLSSVFLWDMWVPVKQTEAAETTHYYNKETKELVSAGTYVTGEIPMEFRTLLRRKLILEEEIHYAIIAAIATHRLDAEIRQQGVIVLAGICFHRKVDLEWATWYDGAAIIRQSNSQCNYDIKTEWTERAVALAANIIHDYKHYSRFPTEWCLVLAGARSAEGFRDCMLRNEKLLCVLEEVSCSGDLETKIDVATRGGATLVLALMEEHLSNQSLQQTGCKIMGCLAMSKHPAILEAIADANGVDILLDAFFKYPKDKIIFHHGGSAALLVREFENEKKQKENSLVL